MIDLNPSDVNCVFTTLNFVCDQAQRYCQTPIVTFDQPLFQKATDIIEYQDPSSSMKKLVLRLGKFHTQMSFLGCIGHLMAGSGLHETIETVYASNAVTHMLSGKAVQRALHGHMMVDTAFTVLLLENQLDVQFTDTEKKDVNQSMSFLSEDPDHLQANRTVRSDEHRDFKNDLNNLGLLFDQI